jgi:catechol 2,3-dioxygenase-like lactoylglutathione lyase family enzyme
MYFCVGIHTAGDGMCLYDGQGHPFSLVEGWRALAAGGPVNLDLLSRSGRSDRQTSGCQNILGPGRQIACKDNRSGKQPNRKSDRDPGLLTLGPHHLDGRDRGQKHCLTSSLSDWHWPRLFNMREAGNADQMFCARALWLPDCSVVGEDNSSRVEGLETLDPFGDWREITTVTLLDGARSKEVAAESCRRVMALAGDDHRPVTPANDDRLVASRVARCRHDEHVVQNLRLAIQALVTEPTHIEEFGEGVVGRPRCLELDSLGEDRSSNQLRVPAAMIEMEVTVHDVAHVLDRHSCRRQRLGHRSAARSVMSIDVRMRAHAGIDQDDAVRMEDDVTQTGLDLPQPGSGLLGRPDEVAEVDTAHGQLDHHGTGYAGLHDGGAGPSTSRDPAPDSALGAVRLTAPVAVVPGRFVRAGIADGAAPEPDARYALAIPASRSGPCQAVEVEPRVSLITLGVADLARSYRFYKDGLGLQTTRRPEEGIVFFQTRGVTLALYPYSELAEDVGPGWDGPPSKFAGITLAHNVRERREVDEVQAVAATAGAEIVKPAANTSWGGYSGYFTNPDGYLWEVAWGAFEFNEDGSLHVT